MRHLNVKSVFICFAVLLFVVACADNTSKKPAEAPSQTAETPSQTETAETPSQPAMASVEEVTLTVTGMT